VLPSSGSDLRRISVQLLTFKGPLGSARSPQIGGKHTITTELLERNSDDPVPVKVSIECQFSAGGR